MEEKLFAGSGNIYRTTVTAVSGDPRNKHRFSSLELEVFQTRMPNMK